MRSFARLWVIVAVSILAAACSRALTLSEYAEQVEALVLDMNVALNQLEGDRDASARTVESEQAYYAARVTIRHDFISELGALDPPPRAEDLHAEALDVIGRLVAAEENIDEKAQAATSLSELNALWTSEDVAAFLAADEDALALCRAAQAEFDATEESAIGSGTPWIPEEMREVVKVALACDADDI